MTDLRKAAEMALEALEEYCITRAITRPIASSDALRQALAQPERGASMNKIDLIIDALSISQNSVWSALNEQALAAARELQAEKQEPVTWAETNDLVCALLRQAHDVLAMASYPMRRPWVGLTDWERNYYNNRLSGSGVAEDIEFELKERNGGS